MHLGTERFIFERKGAKKLKTKNWRASCVVFQYTKCTSRQKCTFPGPIPIKFAPGKVHLGTQKGPKTPPTNWRASCAVFQYNLKPKCTSRQKCTFPGPITIKFAPGKVHLGTQKGPKTQKKIGARPVLFLRVENRVGGSVCEALLEPTCPFLRRHSLVLTGTNRVLFANTRRVYIAIPPLAAYTAVPVGHLWNTSKG